jgi:hypothetical protein
MDFPAKLKYLSKNGDYFVLIKQHRSRATRHVLYPVRAVTGLQENIYFMTEYNDPAVTVLALVRKSRVDA